MNFTRMGQWYELSDCGGYTVAASRVQDRFKFQAYKLAPGKGQTAELLGTFDDAEGARGRCRAHRERIGDTVVVS